MNKNYMGIRENTFKMKVLSGVVAAFMAIILLAGCSSYSSSNTTTSPVVPTGGQNPVNITGFAFSPATLTIAKGTKVTWTNNDSTTHTVTSDNGIWDSGNLAVGNTFSYTFIRTGTFPYHCKIHTSMTAKIVVQ
jgi:plastocyanin